MFFRYCLKFDSDDTYNFGRKKKVSKIENVVRKKLQLKFKRHRDTALHIDLRYPMRKQSFKNIEMQKSNLQKRTPPLV